MAMVDTNQDPACLSCKCMFENNAKKQNIS